MRLRDFLRAREGRSGATSPAWRVIEVGILFGDPASLPEVPKQFSGTTKSPFADAVIEELLDEGLATSRDGHLWLPWEKLYSALSDRALQPAVSLLGLPNVVQIAPSLGSRDTLSSATFGISLTGWIDQNRRPVTLSAICGAAVQLNGELRLMPEASWNLVQAVRDFEARAVRTPAANRAGWGRVRRCATIAEADVDNFLMSNVVLSPATLDVRFRKVNVADTTVVEIEPTFENAPQNWLQTFDAFPDVRAHYTLNVAGGGVVHVELPKATQSVLREIKRWPARRAAGARAEAFLLNPIAALGDDAEIAIDLNQFEHAKQEAGVTFDRFHVLVERDATGFPMRVGLNVEPPNGDALKRWFHDDGELKDFTDRLADRLRRGLPLLSWDDYEFILDGDACHELTALYEVAAAKKQPPVVIQKDHVFDLSAYSERVAAIGDDQPYLSAYIIKKSDADGWFPENLFAVFVHKLAGSDGEITLPITVEALPDIEELLHKARADGATEVTLPGCSQPLPLEAAAERIAAFRKALVDPKPALASAGAPGDMPSFRPPTLVIRSNIDSVEHIETREEVLSAPTREMRRPSSMRPEIRLKDHQRSGIARLQQLFEASPKHCRGVLMADDMGLGKTIQLLAFIVEALERDPKLPPALIVAPVALLQNWADEISKFFHPGAIRTLTAYGTALAPLKARREEIDAALREQGLVRFLLSGWRGNARIVLTTYETLRDLEFSFALEPWSILVCDEAQKVKNPNAGVTRAARKLNVRFRVACTGTPVENSLSDLWCLFDLIQPGLLGALNEFGKTFGRPIEIGGPAGDLARERLRRLIDPQVIRRTKAEVAKDLPRKLQKPCAMPMSQVQRDLYVNGVRLIAEAAAANEDRGSKVHHLGLLAHFRLVCADPRRYGVQAFAAEDPATYRLKSPKLDWLLRTLHEIESAAEKALVFAEHREIQRMLQHYIATEFGFKPKIVNGDTSVAETVADNRKRVINEFQEATGFGVIILSPLAVGFGVNIQEANHVIHYLRHWNPAKEDQATDRAFRIGQTKDVHVYCPLVTAPDFQTFDVKLDAFLDRKRAMATDMLHAAGSLSGVDLDVMEIIPPGGWPHGEAPVTSEDVTRASPDFLEALAAALWAKKGFECRLTQRSDAGVDVVAVRGSDGVLIQCKSSGAARALGWEAVKDVVAGEAVYGEHFPTVRFSKIALTNHAFNTRAKERAKANGVEVIERDALLEMVTKHPMQLREVVSYLGRSRV